MKSSWLEKIKQTKRGVASLYVVIFATMVFGIVALSCIRIMLSEVSQSTDDDLSRSAYDAAMAGVEDAKRAVGQYYSCLNGVDSGGPCDGSARSRLFQDNCNTSIGVADYLGYSGYGHEILVQEKNNPEGDYADQAYTCVIVSDEVPDYRGTLTNDTRTRVVPIKATGGSNINAQSGPVNKIKLQWYSRMNEGSDAQFGNFSGSNKLPSKNLSPTPPAISLTYIQTGSQINLSDFQKPNNSGTVNSSVMLLPNGEGSGTVLNDIASYGNLSDNNGGHSPVGVLCNKTDEFACTVEIPVPTISNNSNAFLVISLPYGDTLTDFSVLLYNDNQLVKFKGAQISIDSTGRTNQLFRRVETRLEPSDLFFPYPLYALSIGGNGEDNSGVSKSFWITSNCWYNSKAVRGGICNNNGSLD